MLKKISFLVVAAGLTIVAVFIQQFSSSDRPYKTSIDINNQSYNVKLPVVHEGNRECLIEINIGDTSIHGQVFYKRYKFNEDWKINQLVSMNENMVSILPQQNPNVKIAYYVKLESKGMHYYIAKDNPIIIRFQGEIPKYIQFPQVAIMFLALIFACFSGILALFNVDSYIKYSKITFYLFTISAFILSLIVHIISFRHIILNLSIYNDLTFYKNLVIFLLWFGVYQLNKKHSIRILVFIVAIITLMLYCLPQHLLISLIH